MMLASCKCVLVEMSKQHEATEALRTPHGIVASFSAFSSFFPREEFNTFFSVMKTKKNCCENTNQ